ncbi:hypothetical protein P152DRAFT_445816 [Eremomyces bilateralis CBS 781.70]|uniref:Gag-like protein n=1 Tax=Eremomyces bilateralis CBS 781.70 TaxID=1392243 RepID=A0A6G1GDE3_9PEZI|nr:uncharacterized protein P152DRAFT_445816 [Eremomyces bilateralis CBS 781.70]KAF1816125.1 hypothetical protein P152DRAFT_445816 [Eremomyces bilateralis CBS 781.70]
MEKEQAGTPARDPAMGQILERLGRIEAGIAKDRGRPAVALTTKAPTWSEIAAGGKTKAVVEVRLSEMAGAVEETTEEKLQRIKKVIPDAKALIPHHRAAGKISVVVLTTTRRDQIIATGIAGDDGVKLIRRPKLLMVMGIPINTQITTGESEGNTEWARQMSNQNTVKIERVSWLYKKEKLAAIRKAGSQTKGLVIIECFRCWKWGHTQSVCNADSDTCGRCAKQHPTRGCIIQDLQEARCAGCKEPGHFAWMTRSCAAYKSFAVGQRATENRLNEATVAVQSQNQNLNVTTHQVRHVDEGYTLVEHSQKRKRAGPGRPSGTTVAARAPG